MCKVITSRNYHVLYSAVARKFGKPMSEEVQLPEQLDLYMKDDSYAFMLRDGVMLSCNKDDWDCEYPEFIYFSMIGDEIDESYIKIATLRKGKGRSLGRWVMLNDIPPIEELRNINRIFPSARVCE